MAGSRYRRRAHAALYASGDGVIVTIAAVMLCAMITIVAPFIAVVVGLLLVLFALPWLLPIVLAVAVWRFILLLQAQRKDQAQHSRR